MKILYPFYILIFFALMAFAIPKEQGFVHPNDNCEFCHSMILPDESYQKAQGQWLEQEDGHYWYRHTDEEYDTIDCRSCHSEMSPTIWACPQEGQSCKLINDMNGNLILECENMDLGPQL